MERRLTIASGDSIASFRALDNEPPSTNYAAIDLRNGRPILGYNESTNQDAIFSGVLPRNYGASGITLTIEWMAATATSGDVMWQAAFEREDTTTNLSSDSFATAQSAAAATAPATSGQPKYTTITFTNSQIDGLLVGEGFRLKVTRNASSGSDTMSGNSQLIACELKET